MRKFGLGLAIFYISSADAFAREVLPEQATQYSCSESLLFYQLPYKIDGKTRSLWFVTSDTNEDGIFDDYPVQAAFAEGFWDFKYDSRWESTVRFAPTDGIYIEFEAVCEKIGQGCTLKFSAQSEIAYIDAANLTCKESPYSPKYQNLEMEMVRADELGGLKFQGLLWDMQGYLRLSFDDYRVGDEADWKRYLLSTKVIKRYGPKIAFTMGTTTHFGSCSLEPEEFCSSGEARWPEVNVLLSQNADGSYEGTYHPLTDPSSESSGKMMMRPR